MLIDLSHKKQTKVSQEYAQKHPGELSSAFNHHLSGMQAAVRMLNGGLVKNLEGKVIEIQNNMVQYSFAASLKQLLDGKSAAEFGPPVSHQLVDQWLDGHDHHPRGLDGSTLHKYLQNFIEFIIKNNCNNE